MNKIGMKDMKKIVWDAFSMGFKGLFSKKNLFMLSLILLVYLWIKLDAAGYLGSEKKYSFKDYAYNPSLMEETLNKCIEDKETTESSPKCKEALMGKITLLMSGCYKNQVLDKDCLDRDWENKKK